MRRFERVFLAERFQPLLQPEHTNQIRRGRRLGQRLDRCRITIGNDQRIAVETLEQFEDRVRRRIVLAARALGDLLTRLRSDDSTRPRIQRQREREGQRPRRRQLGEHAARGIFHDSHRHALVRDTQFFCAPRIDCLAGQQHVEGGGRADHPRQAMNAAPSGHDAEHHFGQPEPRAGLINNDAITTRERELQPTAQTKTFDQRERRIRHLREPHERIPAALDERHRRLGIRQRAEFGDVGARDKAARLARSNDQRFRRLAIKDVERLVEFGKRLL